MKCTLRNSGHLDFPIVSSGPHLSQSTPAIRPTHEKRSSKLASSTSCIQRLVYTGGSHTVLREAKGSATSYQRFLASVIPILNFDGLLTTLAELL
jgi:hypothetical protein